jgi:NADPH-dependent 2,4-dienoyl-CoA reductase/sulfur reductase-like enzyme
MLAQRGHRVVLFEETSKLGGQIAIAARATWREPLTGIVRWLEHQVRGLGVDVRIGQPATADLVLDDEPDIVIVATGGRPNKGQFVGHDLAANTWDILRGVVAHAENVLVFDDNGQHQALSCAEFLAARKTFVEVVTPGRMIGEEVGATNVAIHLREFSKLV